MDRDVCWICGGKLCWDCDYDYEEFYGEKPYGDNGDELSGFVACLHCTNCGADIIYTVMDENEDE